MIQRFRPGVVLNFKHKNIVSNTIASVLGHYWTHTGIVVKVEGSIIHVQEAMGTYRDDLYKVGSLWKRTKFLMNIQKMFGGKVITNEYTYDQLMKWHENNQLKVMDFGINPNNPEFAPLVAQNEGQPYDYFSALAIGIRRIFRGLGCNFEETRSVNKKLFCSELVAGAITKLTPHNVKILMKTDSDEDIAPEHISLVYDRLKFHRRI